MTIKTRSIILGTQVFNDKYRIVYAYSINFGKISVLWPSSRKSKKTFTAIPAPFIEVEMVLYKSNKFELFHIKESCIIRIYHSIYSNPVKSDITLFLSEIILKSISQSLPDLNLYVFVQKSISLLANINNGYENFHIYFLLQFTQHIGINPNIENYSKDCNLFSINEGTFSSIHKGNDMLSKEESTILIKLIRMSPYNIYLYKFNRMERSTIITKILHYYAVHIPYFKEIKSLKILTETYHKNQ